MIQLKNFFDLFYSCTVLAYSGMSEFIRIQGLAKQSIQTLYERLHYILIICNMEYHAI
jgi:hypothetical protein